MKTKTLNILLAAVLCIGLIGASGLIGCGDDGTNKSHYACDCNKDGENEQTTVCADSKASARTEAESEVCGEVTNCECTCEDLYLEEGC